MAHANLYCIHPSCRERISTTRVCTIDDLIDVVGENENHPLASLMEVIGVLIEKYEEEHVPELTEV